MTDPGLRLASSLGLALLPLLLLQGSRVRRVVPRLPEAGGPTHGVVEGADPAVRLLVLGESTVAGVGAADHREALAGQTARSLGEAGGFAVHWRAIGRIGATAHTARTELLEPAGDIDADLVVVALGVNDTLRLHGWRRWTRDLQWLFAALRSRSAHLPLVLSGVPPIARFPALPRPLRDVLGTRARMLDRAAERLAGRLDRVVYVPIPPLLDRVVEEYFCEDRFHPSAPGYDLWGRSLGRAAAEQVRRQRRGG
jgi:lysophospholipase L1-like esterase